MIKNYLLKWSGVQALKQLLSDHENTLRLGFLLFRCLFSTLCQFGLVLTNAPLQGLNFWLFLVFHSGASIFASVEHEEFALNQRAGHQILEMKAYFRRSHCSLPYQLTSQGLYP